MAYSYVDFPSKSVGDTIPVSFPYAGKDEVYIVVGGTEVSSSLYEWTSDGLITCLSGFPSGAGRVERRTPIDSLGTELTGTAVLDYKGTNRNFEQLLHISQETADQSQVSLRYGPDGTYSAEGKGIVDVATPTSASDAATKNYVDTRLAADVASVAASASSAAGSSVAASGSAGAASSAANAAAASADLSEAWAETIEDVEVVAGAYSAKHHAVKAADSAFEANKSETDAASSAELAERWAVGPDIGPTLRSAKHYSESAATSAASAATSETNAATSETNAATSATSAVTSETNAATSAASALSAKTAAEAARDQTLSAFDSFDDRYLGVKTSDPTLDNDGNTLVGGSLYYNSVDEVMKVYTGSAWVAAYASLDGALLVDNNLSDLANAATARGNLGLGNVNNTSDAAKPISTATQTALNGKANTSHTHAISQVTGLQTALDGKAALSHTHAISQVTGLQTALDGKAANTVNIGAGTGLTGGGNLTTNRTISANIATQAEAAAGTISTKLMTPQRTAQAIAALAGTVKTVSKSSVNDLYILQGQVLYDFTVSGTNLAVVERIGTGQQSGSGGGG